MRFALSLFFLLAISNPSVSFAASNDPNDPNVQISMREYVNWKNALDPAEEMYDLRVGVLHKKSGVQIVTTASFLRSYYANTGRFDPFAKSTLDELTGYASIVDSSPDRMAVNSALISYHSLLKQHITNFEVVSFALTLSRIDVRFGDEHFYKKLRKSLIGLFYKKGAGFTPETAFHIITYGEETYILEQFGGEIKKSEIFKVSRKYYNVHDIVTSDGEFIQLFMDVTTPIKRVLFRQKLLGLNADSNIGYAR